ncbi:MAG: STAS/SEC14 domain-containing protein [Verrucomicrobiales bacterium]|jgi:hypothetical protein|nr:STAS/SEC14 domain-containing protein [Verrucomicrobiales bacterium]HQZ27928.1 STAS/SEC14 domain-containing protein [Verrucomicrobiales bacterium]
MIERIPSYETVFAIRLRGVIEKSDIQSLRSQIEAMLAVHEKIGMVIDITGLDDVTAGAIVEDLKLEASLMGKIWHFPRIAILSDKQWVGGMMTVLGKLVPRVETKAFVSGEMDAALAFASELPEKKKNPRALRFLDVDDPKIIAFEINGKPGREDIEEAVRVFDPRILGDQKFNALVRIVNYPGFHLDILTQESFFSMKLSAIKHIEKYAIVGAKRWMEIVATGMGHFTSMEIRTFDLDEETEAWAWLRE